MWLLQGFRASVAKILSQAAQLQGLHTIGQRRELGQVLRRVTTGSIPESNPRAAVYRRHTPLQNAREAHALKRTQPADHSKELLRIGEHHVHVLRLPIPGYFAKAAARSRIYR